MNNLLQAFAKHAETVRDYLVALIQVDSGIYNIDQIKTILQAPDTTVRMETKWLKSLIESLRIIQKYIQLVQSWSIHAKGLAKNLGATPAEVNKLENFELRASQFLQNQSFDQKYFRWVLEDAAQELDRLIAISHELLTDAPTLISLTNEFQGPFFNGSRQIAENWKQHSRKDFLIPLSKQLQEIDTRGDPAITLQQFGTYLDTISQIISVMPIFVTDSSEVVTYSPQALKTNLGLIKQLLDGTEHLGQFIQIRSQVYSVLITEQKALWNAVLPAETPAEQVIITMGLNPSQNVDDLIPNPFPIDTLSLAIEQAEEALAMWESAINASQPYLNIALVLNQTLQSPAVAKFLQAEQRRLELYQEWHPRIMATFDSLKQSL
jgi:hypothetical protein